MTISLKPLAARDSASVIISVNGSERDGPRVIGTMQYAHLKLQPSCIFSHALVVSNIGIVGSLEFGIYMFGRSRVSAIIVGKLNLVDCPAIRSAPDSFFNCSCRHF